MALKLLSAGTFCSIQDYGRRGYRNFGVPESGALDIYHYTLANQLLNNLAGSSALEIFAGRYRIRFLHPTYIVLSGAHVNASLNEQFLENNKVYQVEAGSELSLTPNKDGRIIYLSVAGGFQAPSYLGSQSQCSGISPGPRLAVGDRVAYTAVPLIERTFSARPNPLNSYFDNDRLGAFPGPEFPLLPLWVKEAIGSLKFTVGSQCSRQGYRLESTLGPVKFPTELLSQVVMPGTVQLTPAGELIVLMRDAQTTGGYPRVLQLDEPELGQLAQKMPGSKLSFIIK